MYDTENYLVTSDNIHGPWSEPVALNNFGFDPSLFHDDDGRKNDCESTFTIHDNQFLSNDTTTTSGRRT